MGIPHTITLILVVAAVETRWIVVPSKQLINSLHQAYSVLVERISIPPNDSSLSNTYARDTDSSDTTTNVSRCFTILSCATVCKSHPALFAPLPCRRIHTRRNDRIIHSSIPHDVGMGSSLRNHRCISGPWGSQFYR